MKVKTDNPNTSWYPSKNSTTKDLSRHGGKSTFLTPPADWTRLTSCDVIRAGDILKNFGIYEFAWGYIGERVNNLDVFRRPASSTAEHNPDKLTPDQVETDKGNRLLTPDEMKKRQKKLVSVKTIPAELETLPGSITEVTINGKRYIRKIVTTTTWVSA